MGISVSSIDVERQLMERIAPLVLNKSSLMARPSCSERGHPLPASNDCWHPPSDLAPVFQPQLYKPSADVIGAPDLSHSESASVN